MRGCLAFVALALLLYAASGIVSCSGAKRATTAPQIIDRCARAMGGRERIDSLRTIRFHPIFPDHGEHPLPFEIKRPNLSRLVNADLVFDGRRGCWLKGSDGRPGPELVDAAELADFEVEIGFYFPAFFDYPAEYRGDSLVEGHETHALTVSLPLGATITYYIDRRTHLPVKAAAELIMSGEIRHPERIYSDYREVAGILFPHGFTYGSRNGVMQGRMEAIEVNVPLNDDQFAIPAAGAQ